MRSNCAALPPDNPALSSYIPRSLPHIVLVAYLQNNLMEWLLMFAGTDFLIVIINYAVTSGLLFIVPGKRFIK